MGQLGKAISQTIAKGAAALGGWFAGQEVNDRLNDNNDNDGGGS